MKAFDDNTLNIYGLTGVTCIMGYKLKQISSSSSVVWKHSSWPEDLLSRVGSVSENIKTEKEFCFLFLFSNGSEIIKKVLE